MNDADLQAATINAERAVLGSLIIDRDAIASVVGILRRDAFSTWKHRTIYGAVVKLWNERTPADVVTVESTIRNAGVGEDRIPTSDLFELMLEVPTAVHAPFYAEQVMTFARRRALIDAGSSIVKAAYGDIDAMDTGELVANLRKRVEPYESISTNSLKTSDDFGLDLAETALARWHGQAEDPAIATRIPTLDRFLHGGLRQGQLIILGARPSMGKTALGVGIALNTRSHIVSLEMTAEEIGKRAVAQLADVPYKIADDRMAALDLRERWLEGAERYRSLPVSINDRPRQTTIEIEGETARLAAERGTQVLIIDHLDFLGDRLSRTDGAEQRTAELVHRCKSLARACNVAVILLAQLNRNVEHRDGFYPQLSDFRNSGAIEQDADVCLLLRRRMYYAERGMLDADADADWFPGQVFQRLDVIVAKNRNGPIGQFQVGWKPDAMAVREVA